MKRNIDELGRIVIPKEMRKELGLENGDSVNIELTDGKIVITNPDQIDYKSIVEEALKYISENKFTDYEIDDERTIEYVKTHRLEDILKNCK